MSASMKSIQNTYPEETNVGIAILNLSEVEDYTSVELAEELLKTNTVYGTPTTDVLTYTASTKDRITLCTNISEIISVTGLVAVLRRCDISDIVTQNIKRENRFNVRMSYKKISHNRWAIVGNFCTLEVPTDITLNEVCMQKTYTE